MPGHRRRQRRSCTRRGEQRASAGALTRSSALASRALGPAFELSRTAATRTSIIVDPAKTTALAVCADRWREGISASIASRVLFLCDVVRNTKRL